MAAKAHVIHDYSVGHAPPRQRRQLWFRPDEPVELPRRSIWSVVGGALVAALAVAWLAVGAAYSATRSVPPSLAETPALPLTETWQPDASLARARLTNLLQGPALAVPSRAAAVPAAIPATNPAEPPSSVAHPREVIIDDAALYPPQTPAAPYPNPTTTPPDAIAPPDTDPQVRTPVLDPENPYRD